MVQFFVTLFERMSQRKGRAQRLLASFFIALSAGASLWVVVTQALIQGSAVLEDFVGTYMPRSLEEHCILFGLNAGMGLYIGMSWWQSRATAAHAALLGVLTIGLAVCVSMLMLALGFEHASLVAGVWSISVFSVLFAKDLPRQ